MTLSKQDFTIGAIYKMAGSGRLSRNSAEHLLNERAGLKPKDAEALASVWERHGLKAAWRKV